MKKNKKVFKLIVAILVVILALLAVAYLYFFIRFRNTCRYSIQGENNVAIADMQFGEIWYCNVPVTKCSGNRCTAPVDMIECGHTKTICGEAIECVCE